MGRSRGTELKMESRKKRPGGAEKMRLKKLKSLEVEAAKCYKLTDLFGAGVTTPACAAAPEDERVEAYMVVLIYLRSRSPSVLYVDLFSHLRPLLEFGKFIMYVI
ncbi:unnamed protein product [Arctogadus glacialis]